MDSNGAKKPEVRKILVHPTSVHALAVLSERSATAGELAAEIDRSAGHVRGQLAKLEEIGVVELVDGEKSNGESRGRRYRSSKSVWFDREVWEELDLADRPGVTVAVVRLIEKDIAEAMLAGTFDGSENHISRTPMVLDAQGYEELITFLGSSLEAILEIRKRAEVRIEDGEDIRSTVVHLVQFDLPQEAPE